MPQPSAPCWALACVALIGPSQLESLSRGLLHRFAPAVKLLVHHLPRWQVIGQQAPRCTGSGEPAQGVKDFAQLAALGRLLVDQG